MTAFVLFLGIGYLFGSLSSAVIVCKAMGLPDPRTQGSHNPGATNVMRIGGKKASYLTFAGDCLKGLFPVLIAKFMFAGNADFAMAGAALGAFLGHLYPLYFGFKGGKGVATLAGVLLGISPLILLGFLLVWVIIVYTTRYVSLASMLGSVATVITAILFNFSLVIVILLTVITIFVIYRHQDNIQKLRNGTENKLAKK